MFALVALIRTNWKKNKPKKQNKVCRKIGQAPPKFFQKQDKVSKNFFGFEKIQHKTKTKQKQKRYKLVTSRSVFAWYFLGAVWYWFGISLVLTWCGLGATLRVRSVPLPLTSGKTRDRLAPIPRD